jgi:hypothetical protein
MTDSICIEDFAGNNNEPGYWADYYPQEGIVVFGGSWCDEPNWIIDHKPTNDELWEYIRERER